MPHVRADQTPYIQHTSSESHLSSHSSAAHKSVNGTLSANAHDNGWYVNILCQTHLLKGYENLLFFGRIHPDKGAVEAIEVARRAGRLLVIAGVVQDQDYFRREVEPWIDGDRVRYVGSVGPAERNELLGGADALLSLINFNEPFGLSMIEAMACGSPVIARPRGSVSELIRHQETGFIVNDLDEAVAAVGRLGEISRKRARRHVEENFSRERMVENYIRVYKEILRINLTSGASSETAR